MESTLALWLSWRVIFFTLLQIAGAWRGLSALGEHGVSLAVAALFILAGGAALRLTYFQHRFLNRRPAAYTLTAAALIIIALVFSASELVIYTG